jgi:uncharacterized protein YlaN (UPF0358 family)
MLCTNSTTCGRPPPSVAALQQQQLLLQLMMQLHNLHLPQCKVYKVEQLI